MTVMEVGFIFRFSVPISYSICYSDQVDNRETYIFFFFYYGNKR